MIYKELKKIIKKYECSECYGTGNFYADTAPLNNSDESIYGTSRMTVYGMRDNICPGCEGTGINVADKPYKELIDEIGKL